MKYTTAIIVEQYYRQLGAVAQQATQAVKVVKKGDIANQLGHP